MSLTQAGDNNLKETFNIKFITCYDIPKAILSALYILNILNLMTPL